MRLLPGRASSRASSRMLARLRAGVHVACCLSARVMFCLCCILLALLSAGAAVCVWFASGSSYRKGFEAPGSVRVFHDIGASVEAETITRWKACRVRGLPSFHLALSASSHRPRLALAPSGVLCAHPDSDSRGVAVVFDGFIAVHSHTTGG
jgi:hypothetical protein